MKISAFLFLLFWAQIVSYGQEMWNPMGRNDLGWASLGWAGVAKNPIWARNNEIFLFNVEHADSDSAPSSAKWSIAKYTGNWEHIETPVTIISGTIAPDCIVDHNGVPHIFLNDPVSNMATVKKYIGGEWIDVGGSPVLTTSSSFFKLMLAPDGTIFTICSGGIKKFDGNNWITLTATLNISPESVFALGQDNTLYAMYNYWTGTGNDYNCFVKKLNGVNWEEVGITDFTGKGVAFDVDNNGVPYLFIGYRLLKFNGNSWEEASNTSEMGLNQTWGGPAYGVYNMKFNDANILYIQYASDGVLYGYLKRWVNGEWEAVPGGGAAYAPYNLTFENDNIYTVTFGFGQTPNVAKITPTGVEQLTGPASFVGPGHDFTVCNNFPMIASTGAAGKAEVRWFNNNEWGILGFPGISENAVVKIKIKAAGDGQIYLAYNNKITDTERKISVKRFTSSGWLPVGDVNFSLTAGENIDLSISHANEPYVLYKSGRVQKFDGNNWVFVGGSAYNGDSKAQLIFDSNDIPHIVVGQTIRKFNGSGWDLLSLPALLLSGAVDSNFTAVFDSDNNLYFAYIDTSYKVRVMKLNGGVWESVGPETMTTAKTTVFNLVLDHNDTPYVLSNENVENFRKRASLKKFNGTNWEFVGEPQFSGTTVSSLQVDFSDNNTPLVSYTSQYGVYFKYFGQTDGWLGSEELVSSQAKSIVIVPNPVNDHFAINGKDISHVMIYDLTGKKIISQKSTTVDASCLRSGLYLIKVTTPEGNVISKFIKR